MNNTWSKRSDESDQKEKLAREQYFKVNAEKFKIVEQNANECKSEKFIINEELKTKTETLNTCQNTYNLLNTHTEAFIQEISQEQALKNLEYEVKSKLNPNDNKFLLTGAQLIEKDDYKKRFEEIFQQVKTNNLKILEEKLTIKTFDEKKKN